MKMDIHGHLDSSSWLTLFDVACTLMFSDFLTSHGQDIRSIVKKKQSLNGIVRAA